MKKLALLLSLLSVVFIAGCGENIFEGQEDKNTTEAERLNISDDLDSGNYLAVLNNQDATATEYAAAAMGLAGLDPVGLIQAMNDAATAGTTGDLGPVTSLVLDPAALDELQTAKDKLAAELAANPTDPDLNFQMTLTSLTSTLTALAEVGQTNSGSIGGFDLSDGISTTEATNLGNFIATNGDQAVSVDVKDSNGNDLPDTLANLIAIDVANVVNTLPNANLGSSSDLNQILTEATSQPGGLNYTCSDINPADGVCDDTTVTAADISNYLTNVLGI